MGQIEVKNVVKSFGQVNALNGLNLQLETGAQYAIEGASGSGKSTLLYLLGGLDQPTQGEIIVEGQTLSNLNDSQLADYRNKSVGFVFQFHFLLPSMSCIENILLPTKIAGEEVSSELLSQVKELASHLGVEHCLEKYPYEVSGGEQQRINIIRALSRSPKLLLCDEPTGNLDSENSVKVVELLKSLSDSFKSTLIVVTHDKDISNSFSNIVQMQDGAVMQNLDASRL